MPKRQHVVLWKPVGDKEKKSNPLGLYYEGNSTVAAIKIWSSCTQELTPDQMAVDKSQTVRCPRRLPQRALCCLMLCSPNLKICGLIKAPLSPGLLIPHANYWGKIKLLVAYISAVWSFPVLAFEALWLLMFPRCEITSAFPDVYNSEYMTTGTYVISSCWLSFYKKIYIYIVLREHITAKICYDLYMPWWKTHCLFSGSGEWLLPGCLPWGLHRECPPLHLWNFLQNPPMH